MLSLLDEQSRVQHDCAPILELKIQRIIVAAALLMSQAEKLNRGPIVAIAASLVRSCSRLAGVSVVNQECWRTSDLPVRWLEQACQIPDPTFTILIHSCPKQQNKLN